MTKTLKQPKVVSLATAFIIGMPPAELDAVADWHDAKADHPLASQSERERHDHISYRLRKVAKALREGASRIAA